MECGVPKDVMVYMISKYLSPVDITRLRGTCKQLYTWYRDDKDFKIWRALFLTAVEWNRRRDIIFEFCLRESAKTGHLDLVKMFANIEGECWCLEGGLFGAAIGGHQELVNFFIEKGARNWNWGWWGAIQGRHHDLIDFFLSKRFERKEICFNYVNFDSNALREFLLVATRKTIGAPLKLNDFFFF